MGRDSFRKQMGRKWENIFKKRRVKSRVVEQNCSTPKLVEALKGQEKCKRGKSEHGL